MIAAITLCAFPLFAADDGQTQPKLNTNVVNWGTTSNDIVSTTNGAGNVKGIHCQFANTGTVTVNMFINGGGAQAISLTAGDYSVDANGNYITGFIPYNVRFTSSIRIQLVGALYGPQVICAASWALD